MKKIQLIGLPGAGKSTAIKLFDQLYDSRYLYLDIAKISNPYKERKFATKITQSRLDTLAESACGIYNLPTINIKIDPSIDIIFKQLRSRGDNIDPEYLSGLKRHMIYSHYTIKEAEELPQLLFKLLRS